MNEGLIELINETAGVAFPPFGTGVENSIIQIAENSIGTSFPTSFKWWLINYGGGQICSDIIYGLDVDGSGRPDIVALAEMNSRDGFYPKSKLVFCVSNNENFYFDLLGKWVEGECAIIQHDVDCDERMEFASSFSDFLERRIRQLCYPY